MPFIYVLPITLSTIFNVISLLRASFLLNSNQYFLQSYVVTAPHLAPTVRSALDDICSFVFITHHTDTLLQDISLINLKLLQTPCLKTKPTIKTHNLKGKMKFKILQSSIYSETGQVSKQPRFSKKIILVPIIVNTKVAMKGISFIKERHRAQI